MKRYYITIEVKERHSIYVEDDVKINRNTVFEHLSEETLIESEWIEATDIEELED
jgi:hypothetical protein